jgi:hypothetical protein
VNRETVERCTILRGLVGSTVHGLNVNDGIEDRDEMGICVEPLEDAMALWDPFEQFIYRTAAEREGRDNARSTYSARLIGIVRDMEGLTLPRSQPQWPRSPPAHPARSDP